MKRYVVVNVLCWSFLRLFIQDLLISNGRKQLLVFINFVDMTGI